MIRVGIVGAGEISVSHAEAYARLAGTTIAAWADPVREKAFKRSERFGGKVFASLEELLDGEPVDVVDICSPDSHHVVQAERALRAGKHVLCEKPLGLSVHDAERVVRLANAGSPCFMVGQVLRFFPEYVWIRDLVKEGALGAPRSAYAARLNPYPYWREWFGDPKLSGGAVTDLMIHDADYCSWVFGEAEAVRAIGNRDPQGIWNYAQSLVSFGSGVTATIESSYRMPKGFPSTFIFRLVCEGGCVEYTNRPASTVTVFESNKEPRHPPIAQWDPFLEEIRYFVGCVERGQKPDLITPEEALSSLKIVLAALESLQDDGEKVSVTSARRPRRTSSPKA